MWPGGAAGVLRAPPLGPEVRHFAPMTTRPTAKNRHGLHRRIPAAVEREVRQRCKFGCVICRAGFYDDAGNPTLRLLENRWVGPTEAWDIKVERARIQVQTAPGRPVLCLRLAPPGTLVAGHCHLTTISLGALLRPGVSHDGFAAGAVLRRGALQWPPPTHC